MQVEGEVPSLLGMETGERVRNTYATYPLLENSPGKLGLILYNIIKWHHLIIKAQAVEDGRAAH